MLCAVWKLYLFASEEEKGEAEEIPNRDLFGSSVFNSYSIKQTPILTYYRGALRPKECIFLSNLGLSSLLLLAMTT